MMTSLQPRPNGSQHFRSACVLMTILFAFTGLIFRLGWIQVRQHEKFVELAERRHYKRIELPARRGMIFDRTGRLLAVSVVTKSIYADPSVVEDKPRVARILSKVLGVDCKRLLGRLNKPKRFVWIKRHVSPLEALWVRRLKFRGIGFREEPKRSYPNGSLAAHVLGFTDVDGHGLEGIEARFDKLLAGQPGYKIVARDGKQRVISVRDRFVVPPRHGSSIVLTIDNFIQSIAEEELARACEAHGAKGGTAIVMSPYSAEILAMANVPTFDPNRAGEFPSAQRRNRAIIDTLEPGSVMKPFVLSLLFSHGLVKENDVFFCNYGKFRIPGRVLHDHHPYGRLSVAEILIHSSNIGMAKLGLILGPARMYTGLRRFGFGERTGIELPCEASGTVRPLPKWSRFTVTSVPMGHEISVTPLQIARAFSVFANGGRLMRPMIVRAITDYAGQQIKKAMIGSTLVREVLSARVARRRMNPILKRVVSEGTGRRAQIAGRTLAAKTGTLSDRGA